MAHETGFQHLSPGKSVPVTAVSAPVYA